MGVVTPKLMSSERLEGSERFSTCGFCWEEKCPFSLEPCTGERIGMEGAAEPEQAELGWGMGF